MVIKRIATINYIIFGIVGIIHLIRAISKWDVSFGPMQVPIWFSYVVFLGTAVLVYYNFKVSRDI